MQPSVTGRCAQTREENKYFQVVELFIKTRFEDVGLSPSSGSPAQASPTLARQSLASLRRREDHRDRIEKVRRLRRFGIEAVAAIVLFTNQRIAAFQLFDQPLDEGVH